MSENKTSAVNTTDNNIGLSESEYRPSDETIKTLNKVAIRFGLNKDEIKSRFYKVVVSKAIRNLKVPDERDRENHTIRILVAEYTDKKSVCYKIGYLITEQDGVIRNREIIHEEGEIECFNIRKGEKVVGIISDVHVRNGDD